MCVGRINTQAHFGILAVFLALLSPQHVNDEKLLGMLDYT
jgi:hypothetical protein